MSKPLVVIYLSYTHSQYERIKLIDKFNEMKEREDPLTNDYHFIFLSANEVKVEVFNMKDEDGKTQDQIVEEVKKRLTNESES